MTVSYYKVISLFNSFSKVSVKIVANMQADSCEINHMLHMGQIRSTRQRATFKAVARLFTLVQEAYAEGKLAGMLLMKIKGAFDHVSSFEILLRRDVRWQLVQLLSEGEDR